MRLRYFALNGMERTEIKASSVVAMDDSGNEYELQWRTTDKEMSLSTTNGTLIIMPRASNVVRLSVIR